MDHIVDFAVPADHRIKLKECEKRDKYLDLARELKKLWNMKVTIITIVIGAFGMVTKGLLKGMEDLDVGPEWGTSENRNTTQPNKTEQTLTHGQKINLENLERIMNRKRNYLIITKKHRMENSQDGNGKNKSSTNIYINK